MSIPIDGPTDSVIAPAAVDSSLRPLPERKRKSPRLRSFHCALHEAGAVRLTDDELDTVTRALVILEAKVITQRQAFTSPARVKAWATLHYGFLDREIFGLVYLDKRHNYLGHQQLFTGTIDGAQVSPRQVLRSVMEYNAAACICLHCHPSFVLTPSVADEQITQRLKDMLSMIDVVLLDHLLIGGSQMLSFAESGLI